jgi:hypothetical protein
LEFEAGSIARSLSDIGRTTVTSETADYAFPLLPLGSYDVRTELSGFSKLFSCIRGTPWIIVLAPCLQTSQAAA